MRRRPTDSKTSLVNNTRSNRLYCLCDGGKEPGREGGTEEGERQRKKRRAGDETKRKKDERERKVQCSFVFV